MNSFFRKTYLQGLYRIASGSLLRHRMRSFLSILGIICGVAAVFATLSIGEGAKREVLDGIRQLGLENIIIRRVQMTGNGLLRQTGIFAEGLRLNDVQLLRSASGAIIDVAYLKELHVEMSGQGPELTPQVVACSASYFKILGIGVSRGRLMLSRDEQQKKLICLLGESISHALGTKGNVGQQIRIGEQLFLIAGIVKNTQAAKAGKKSGVALAREIDQMIFLPFGTHHYLKQHRNSDNDQELDEIIVKMDSQDAAEKLVPLIRRSLDISHQSFRDYQVIVPRQLMMQAKKTQRIFNLVLTAIGGISLVVGGIGIMNVLLATISERTREIGIRRAVGATREDIVAQFLAEALLLTTSGGLIGVLAGYGCSLIIARFAEWNVAVNSITILLPLFTSVLVGVCAGVYPAVKAGKMDPVQALRSA